MSKYSFVRIVRRAAQGGTSRGKQPRLVVKVSKHIKWIIGVEKRFEVLNLYGY